MQHIRWENCQTEPCQTAQALATADCWPRYTVCQQNHHIGTGPYGLLYCEATRSCRCSTMHSFAAAGCSTTIALACLQEKLFHKIEDDFGLDPHGIEVGGCIPSDSSLVRSSNTGWQ